MISEPLRSFEEIYARTEPADVPWAGMRPRPALLTWLDSRPDRPGGSALVIACGFGDDAEELARRGYRVRAFDVAPTAIAATVGEDGELFVRAVGIAVVRERRLDPRQLSAPAAAPGARSSSVRRSRCR